MSLWKSPTDTQQVLRISQVPLRAIKLTAKTNHHGGADLKALGDLGSEPSLSLPASRAVFTQVGDT